MVFVIWLEGSNRTRQVVLLSHTITDNDNVIKSCRCVLKLNLKILSGNNLKRLVADVSDFESSLLVGGDREITVDVGHSTSLTANNLDGCAYDRLAGLVYYMAFHSNLLCKGTCRKEQTC